MKRFASLISRLFEPMVVVPVIVVVGGWISGLRGWEFISFILYIAGLVGVVALLRLWMFRRLKISWDISERPQRVKPLVILLGFMLLNWLVIGLWHNDAIFQMFFLFVWWLFGFFLITLRYKISGHVGIITLAAILILVWYGATWWPILLTVPLVAWARVVGKKHTAIEVFAGILYSSLILFASKIPGY